MGKTLAIKGHLTRREEVIKLLEMLGGKDSSAFRCTNPNLIYFVLDNHVHWDYIGPEEIEKYEIFTLEEFFEKYPFKIGDKVHIYVQNDDIDGRYDMEVTEITSMRWNSASRKIAYKMKNINREFYKEEIKCKADDKKDAHYISECKSIGQGTYAIKIADGYKFDRIDENGNIIVKPIKPKYPTTYDECKAVMQLQDSIIQAKCGYEYKLISYFQQLLMCRDAYWEIAGKELGLGKPWKPDWSNDDETKFCIYTTQNIISLDIFGADNRILAFPTEEMRDTFYKNFAYLIETCKEFL